MYENLFAKLDKTPMTLCSGRHREIWFSPIFSTFRSLQPSLQIPNQIGASVTNLPLKILKWPPTPFSACQTTRRSALASSFTNRNNKVQNIWRIYLEWILSFLLLEKKFQVAIEVFWNDLNQNLCLHCIYLKYRCIALIFFTLASM